MLASLRQYDFRICALRLYRYISECDIRIDFDTNEYPNIFVSRKRYERISEYIRIKRNDTNVIRMNICIKNDTNIRIFKYSYHFQYEYSFVSYSYRFFLYKYIRIFVRIVFLIRIYSDIHSYRNQYECHTQV